MPEKLIARAVLAMAFASMPLTAPAMEKKAEVNSIIKFHLPEGYNSIYGIRRGKAVSKAKGVIKKALQGQHCTGVKFKLSQESSWKYFTKRFVMSLGISIVPEVLAMTNSIAREGYLEGTAVCQQPLQVSGHIKHYSSLPLKYRNKVRLEIRNHNHVLMHQINENT